MPDPTITNTDRDYEGVVFPIRGEGPGTCFLVREDDDYQYLLTAQHVAGQGDSSSVSGRTAVKIEINKTTYSADVIQVLQEHDIALLRLPRVPLAARPLELGRQTKPGVQFASYGFPRGGLNRFSHEGKIGAKVPGSVGRYEITFDHTYSERLGGLSGAPVIDKETGAVVGVMLAHKAKDTSFGEIAAVDSFASLLNYTADESDVLRCYVVLSETERNPVGFNLQEAVRDIFDGPAGYKHEGKPFRAHAVYAADMIASREQLAEAVQALCRSEVAIFDLTDFEPAVMLLLGIRSVVRRGVTISSVGADYTVGDVIELPFNIKEVNLASHSQKMIDEMRIEPGDLIRQRIRDGLKQFRLLQYLDLPTFDAIRNLPQGSRTRIPHTDQILVLCSFSQSYQNENWKYVRRGFARLRRDPEYNVLRALDLASPRLSSQAIYEEIRRTALCIVDWSEWRPNVFFELGVRLAVSTASTACIIEERYELLIKRLLSDDPLSDPEIVEQSGILPPRIDINSVNLDDPHYQMVIRRFRKIAAQCEPLLNLFKPLPYRPEFGRRSPYADIVDSHEHFERDLVSFVDKQSTFPNPIYEVANHAIDPTVERAATPVWRELIEAADGFSSDDTEGISSVLYKSNTVLKEMAERAGIERRLAGWLYINSRYKPEQIKADAELLDNYLLVGQEISRILLKTEPELAELIRVAVRGMSDTLPQVKQLKESAKANRDFGDYAAALSDLNKAIELLKAEQEQAVQAGDDAYLQGLKPTFADYYGMMGGVYRRMGNLDEAIRQYQRGLEYEVDDSYNLSNALVIPILKDPNQLKAEKDDIARAIETVRRQVAAKRKDQWWAWADLGLFNLLSGNLGDALDAYSKFRGAGARMQDYDSTITVLDELRGKLAGADPAIAELVSEAIAYLDSNKSG